MEPHGVSGIKQKMSSNNNNNKNNKEESGAKGSNIRERSPVRLRKRAKEGDNEDARSDKFGASSRQGWTAILGDKYPRVNVERMSPAGSLNSLNAGGSEKGQARREGTAANSIASGRSSRGSQPASRASSAGRDSSVDWTSAAETDRGSEGEEIPQIEKKRGKGRTETTGEYRKLKERKAKEQEKGGSLGKGHSRSFT